MALLASALVGSFFVVEERPGFGLFWPGSLHQDSAVLKNIQMGLGKCIFWLSQIDLILNVILMSF